jgi:hypothetical protein
MKLYILHGSFINKTIKACLEDANYRHNYDFLVENDHIFLKPNCAYYLKHVAGVDIEIRQYDRDMVKYDREMANRQAYEVTSMWITDEKQYAVWMLKYS